MAPWNALLFTWPESRRLDQSIEKMRHNQADQKRHRQPQDLYDPQRSVQPDVKRDGKHDDIRQHSPVHEMVASSGVDGHQCYVYPVSIDESVLFL
jgi:hypothetical protein